VSLTYTARLVFVPPLTIALTLIAAFPAFRAFTRDVAH
jgi:hypothetical protein